MQPDADHEENPRAATQQRVALPVITPATPEEVARRRALVADIDHIRERIGPLDFSVDELIDADFYELDDL
jgi:hypothetical protein